MHLLPQDISYVDSFNDLGETVILAVENLRALKENQKQVQMYRVQSSKLETEADMLVHSIVQKSYTSPNTPYYRLDMVELAKSVDRTIDQIDHLVHDMDIYGVTDPICGYIDNFLDIYDQGAHETKNLLHDLFEGVNTRDTLTKTIISLRSIGSHGESAYEKSLLALFEHEGDAIEVIKGKALIESMRSITRVFKSLATIIDEIVMRNENV